MSIRIKLIHILAIANTVLDTDEGGKNLPSLLQISDNEYQELSRSVRGMTKAVRDNPNEIYMDELTYLAGDTLKDILEAGLKGGK